MKKPSALIVMQKEELQSLLDDDFSPWDPINK